MRRLSYVIFISSLYLSSCTNSIDDSFSVDFGYTYFPLEAGKFLEYQVDSIIYDNLGLRVQTKSSLLREEFEGPTKDLEGNDVYRIHRFWKKIENDDWEQISNWTTYLNNDRAIRSEENLRFIKMIFPLQEGLVWDGNAFFDDQTVIEVEGETIEVYKNWEYEVEEFVPTETIGSKTYEDVALIRQADEESAVDRRYSIEKYAKGIGMIYKELKIYDTQCISQCAGQEWEEKVEQGFSLVQTLINHN